MQRVRVILKEKLATAREMCTTTGNISAICVTAFEGKHPTSVIVKQIIKSLTAALFITALALIPSASFLI